MLSLPLKNDAVIGSVHESVHPKDVVNTISEKQVVYSS